MDMILKHTGFYLEDNIQRNPVMTEDEKLKRLADLKEKILQ